MSKIASIEIIEKIEKHPDPEVHSLSIATVMGWSVVIKSSEYNVGDKVVYVETDSVVPEIPEFEFLRQKHFRVKTIKLRGVYSNGLCVPLHVLSTNFPSINDFEVGQSVADLIDVKHYEKPLTLGSSGDAKGNLPSIVIKTDEDNLRSSIRNLESFKGIECVITEKIDGQSVSFFLKNSEFGVCKRNFEVKDSPDCRYWNIARHYQIEEKMRTFGEDFVLQGEIAGPGIQSNNYGSKNLELFIFNGINKNREYMNHDEVFNFCAANNIPTVPVVWRGTFNFTINELQEMAEKLFYKTGKKAEGIVIRPVIEQKAIGGGRLSFKVVSDIFKFKNNE